MYGKHGIDAIPDFVVRCFDRGVAVRKERDTHCGRTSFDEAHRAGAATTDKPIALSHGGGLRIASGPTE